MAASSVRNVLANHLGLTRARTHKRPISSGLNSAQKCGTATIPVLEIVYANRLQKCCEESRMARWRGGVLDAVAMQRFGQLRHAVTGRRTTGDFIPLCRGHSLCVVAFAYPASRFLALQLLYFSDKQAATAEDILHMSTTRKKRLYAPLACR